MALRPEPPVADFVFEVGYRSNTFDRKTGKVVEDPKVKPEFDYGAIDAAVALHGYYLGIGIEIDWGT